MANFGKGNFYALKSMLGKGKMSPEMFTNQKNDFLNAMPIYTDNSKLEKGLEDIRNEIRNKEVSNVDFKGITGGILELLETVKRGNNTQKNTHRFKF